MSEKKQSYAAALVEALHDSLRSDPKVSIVGGYVLGLGPQRSLTDRLKNDFPDRVFDPPTSEAGLAALGAGAAMAGVRPFVDLGTASFSYLAWSPITNEAAVAHYMSGGKLRAPVTYHMLHGVRGGGAPQHSQSPQAMLWNAPGLQIALPSYAADAYGLVRTALASPNPTFVVSHAKLLGIETAVPDPKRAIPFGQADIKRRGRDVTIVATSLMVHYSLLAAEALAKDGIEAEVVDPRTLVPLDEKTILESVSRTGRLVVVDECPLRGGIASEISATVAERGFRHLKAPIVRITRPDTPVPYSLPLEEFVTPDPAKIETAVRRLLT